jgi:hypothetical protein
MRWFSKFSWLMASDACGPPRARGRARARCGQRLVVVGAVRAGRAVHRRRRGGDEREVLALGHVLAEPWNIMCSKRWAKPERRAPRCASPRRSRRRPRRWGCCGTSGLRAPRAVRRDHPLEEGAARPSASMERSASMGRGEGPAVFRGSGLAHSFPVSSLGVAAGWLGRRAVLSGRPDRETRSPLNGSRSALVARTSRGCANTARLDRSAPRPASRWSSARRASSSRLACRTR